MTPTVQFNQRLIDKYGVTGPRYTSYPTAVQFHEGFDEIAYRMFAAQSNEDFIPRPLSLYLHLPFCHSLCYYCGCMKKVTQHDRHGVTYLEYLAREIELQGQLFDRDREVIQLHFGGGTPTFFDDEQLNGIIGQLGRAFHLIDRVDREYSIEIDPRTVDRNRLGNLAHMGFNRLSLGVQDFDPEVQKAVNRVQGEEETLELIHAARANGFNSVSIDLIYGLPKQNPESFMRTIDSVLAARPDRLSVYNYAHLPHMFRAQRLIREEELPAPEAKLEILSQTIEKLTEEGYVYIGMDHFALPEDELFLARDKGELHRNFQGYSTCAECDLVGIGVSAISKIGHSYAQNRKDIREWEAELEAGRLPVWRGVQLTREDVIRQDIIETIMCRGELRFREIEERYHIDFSEHFALEIESLGALAKDGLITLDEESLRATPAGLLLLRVVAMAFDEYLNRSQQPVGFSKVI
ncbi:MAG: oxygen-independent coproporphyrinogen III oxidase [Gammaproteobacteria bacterium]